MPSQAFIRMWVESVGKRHLEVPYRSVENHVLSSWPQETWPRRKWIHFTLTQIETKLNPHPSAPTLPTDLRSLFPLPLEITQTPPNSKPFFFFFFFVVVVVVVVEISGKRSQLSTKPWFLSSSYCLREAITSSSVTVSPKSRSHRTLFRFNALKFFLFDIALRVCYCTQENWETWNHFD